MSETASLRVGLAGAGRVAHALAPHLAAAGHRIVAVVSRHEERAAELARRLPGEALAAGLPADPPVAPVDLPLVDWWFLAVRDEAIAAVDARLDAAGAYAGARLVTHTSGAWSAGVLRRARARGLAVASVHPLFSIAGPAPSSLRGLRFTVEGDEAAAAVIERWLAAAGALARRIRSEDKSLYHAAACIAANYVVALLDAAERLFVRAGLPAEEARAAAAGLARSALENTESLGPVRALTGPIARGDAATVGAHLAALAGAAPDLREIYAALARYTLDLARRQAASGGGADPADLEALAALLQPAPPRGAAGADPAWEGGPS
ncbi:MAG: DUF2520 domain-containing protein [Firmicutes bacterium]|nr:DUF2520 domain-containing protein [Bacillota bacterium]